MKIKFAKVNESYIQKSKQKQDKHDKKYIGNVINPPQSKAQNTLPSIVHHNEEQDIS